MNYLVEKYLFFVLVLFSLLLVETVNSHEFSPETTPDKEEVSFSEKLMNIAREIERRLIREDPNPANTASNNGGTSGGGADSGEGKGADGGEDGEEGQDNNYGYNAAIPNSPDPATQTPGSSGKELPTPEDVGIGHDDDVIAKGIREAAEKETDPELREKLWDEYRKYKKGA